MHLYCFLGFFPSFSAFLFPRTFSVSFPSSATPHSSASDTFATAGGGVAHAGGAEALAAGRGAKMAAHCALSGIVARGFPKTGFLFRGFIVRFFYSPGHDHGDGTQDGASLKARTRVQHRHARQTGVVAGAD
jgi:hypothetical protein